MRVSRSVLIALSVLAPLSSPSWSNQGAPGPTRAELAGNSLTAFPHFEYVAAFHEGDNIEVAIDPGLFPALVGQTVDVYVCDSRDVAGWRLNPALVDVSGGTETLTISGVDLQANTFIADPGSLSGDAGTGLGVGYDVVVDVNRDGVLDAGDVIDGLDNAVSGAYVVRDPTLPGPLAVTETLYSGGVWKGQNTYYPTNIASLGQLPLVVISHGNGHNYQWYDHIGFHLGSYGYIVMSHENETGPGIETASATTLDNTDYFLNNLATIDGGVLVGHVDTSRILWIGHSRGGEGVTRAYDKIFDGTFTPTSGYTLADLKLISSIAPTDFLGPASSTVHDANYHLWTGGADSDVNGCASCDLCQTFQLYNRAEDVRQSISLHGVGHGDFHDGLGGSVAFGPCLVGRPDTHTIMRGYLLPMAKHYSDGNVPGKDYLWRQWETFRPPSAPTGECIVVDLMYEHGANSGPIVIDDFQTNDSVQVSSSGGRIHSDLRDLAEGLLDDPDNDFTHSDTEFMNGMTQAGPGDIARGLTFSWQTDRVLIFETVAADRDWSGHGYLAFRACQQTRHPLTDASTGDVVFDVTLKDIHGTLSTIRIDAYGGGGIEEPYQRHLISSGGFSQDCGVGDGWANEFETVRIRLGDFLANGSGLDLTQITRVGFQFGPSHGSAEGRLGFDNLMVTVD